MDNPIIYAIPIFFILIAIEFIYGIKTKNNTYRTHDAITSVSTGVLSQVTGAVTKLILVTIYAFIFEHFSFIQLSADDWWVWVYAFIFYDLCYYWFHRVAHEYNVFWAGHVTHHSSEDYNLTTALRQTSTTFWFGWVFYVPMALSGIPPLVFFVVGALNLLYQYWVHSEHIPKLGWYELFFVTPSNHRVHHGQNDAYIDRNYGGVFILWDRMFGSFQEELDDDPVVFGIKKPIESWNPLWANVHYYVQLYQDAARTEKMWDKIRVWFKRTGWRPDDVAEKYPLNKRSIDDFKKFSTQLSSSYQAFVGIQFLFANLLTIYVLFNVEAFSILESLVWIGIVSWWLLSLGLFMELRSNGKIMELVRIHLFSGLGIAVFSNEVAYALVGSYYLVSMISYFSLKLPRVKGVGSLV